MASIIEIEGIGDTYATTLRNAGVSTTEALLERGATPKGRDDLAEITGISDRLILKWVNHADLFRINGVAGEYAELLEAAGVDTVPELAQRNVANLTAAMTEVNTAKNLVRRTPTEAQVAAWVAEAKTLPRKVSY
jgi:predicted flap endonuclease-1-like 5' DNA nuclease